MAILEHFIFYCRNIANLQECWPWIFNFQSYIPVQQEEHVPIQEMFHDYLNKFENDVTHLFLVILGNN